MGAVSTTGQALIEDLRRRNVGVRLREIAHDLGIVVHVVG